MAVAANKKRPPNHNSPKNVVATARSGGARPARSWKPVWDNVKSLLGAVLIFLVIRTFFVEAYRIPSPSMVPTLLVGDWLFVNKLVYGPHIPFTNVTLPGYGEPKRGDVVVFKSPTQFDQLSDPNPTLVKRLVGLPGDTLYMRDDLLYLNGVAQPQGKGAADNPTEDPSSYNPLFEWQHTNELKSSRFPPPPSRPTLGNWGPIVVPPGHYFMLGDNRHASKDGRFWGLVPRENFRARPIFVYYSFRGGGESDESFPAITDIRWGRIGTRIK